MAAFESIDGGVTAPKGFQASGACAGFRKGRDDMALIFSSVPCTLAGTFTSNLVKAAPVLWDREIVQKYREARAIIVNSGVANACTGEEGMRICEETAEAAADALNIRKEEVLIGSTGVIGNQIPMDIIRNGVSLLVPALSDTREAAYDAAGAIMTTDTVRKEAAVSFTLGGKKVTLAGMSKGSGMIHPNMCTMLAFLTTDAAISAELLQKALSECVEDSFNMISVDGDMSTNDTCLLMANGLAGNREITEEGEDYILFRNALSLISKCLARNMAKDGEGAAALFEVKVQGASSRQQAVTLAKSVIGSSLVKTAIAGHDANWGRIICAMGYSGASFDESRVSLRFQSKNGEIAIAENGVTTGFDEALATKILSDDEITAVIDLHEGSESAVAWGCDLTHEYININADYRS